MDELNLQKNNQTSQIPVGQMGESMEKEAPFYNVMPKEEGKGPLIGPKIQVGGEKEAEGHNSGPFQHMLQQHKVLIIVGFAVLILAYPAYYLLNKLVFNKDSKEALLNEEILKQQDSNKLGQTQQAKFEFKTPKEWQARFFGNEICQEESQCGDEGDPDRDGLKNLEEFEKETDPNNSDSDQDGLADGDEVYIFGSEPDNPSTAGDPNYNDGQYIKGGYNPKIKDAKLTAGEIADISAKMKEIGLHQPTATTLGSSLLEIYKFNSSGDESATSSPATAEANTLEGIDQSPESKQERDAQRSNTIKNISIALIRYFEDNQTYPKADNFTGMFNAVKPFTRVATNPIDPINKGQYIYTYAPSSDGRDFTLTFFSETQNQTIRTHSDTAKKYQEGEQAAIYDDQRKTNLETIRTALLIYSSNNAGGSQSYAFPTLANYQTALMPDFIGEIPKDPKTGEAYEYQVSEAFDSFTLKAILDAPPTGRTGYLCNQEECRYY